MELALGTVQFGLPYGVAGRTEPVTEAEVRAILEHASFSGIRLLDTAVSYGDIEERLPRLCSGLNFGVVSKIPAMKAHAAVTGQAQFAVDAIRRSQDRLGGMLEAMLFHRTDELLAEGGDDVWDATCSFANDAGLRLGVSCYGPEEVRSIQARFAVLIAQVPANAFDQRLHASAMSTDLKHVELHMRSVFLQGLLLMPYEEAIRKVPAAAKPMAMWRTWCKNRGFSPLVGALAIAKGIPGVKYVVVGVDSVVQLKEIVSAWHGAPVVVDAAVACSDPELIDPRRWRAA